MTQTTAHELTTREKKLKRQSEKKDWYPSAVKFFQWAGSLKSDYDSDEMGNVFRELYP